LRTHIFISPIITVANKHDGTQINDNEYSVRCLSAVITLVHCVETAERIK